MYNQIWSPLKQEFVPTLSKHGRQALKMYVNSLMTGGAKPIEQNAATIIQASARAMKAKKQLKDTKSAATKIQAAVRAMNARKQLQQDADTVEADNIGNKEEDEDDDDDDDDDANLTESQSDISPEVVKSAKEAAEFINKHIDNMTNDTNKKKLAELLTTIVDNLNNSQ